MDDVKIKQAAENSVNLIFKQIESAIKNSNRYIQWDELKKKTNDMLSKKNKGASEKLLEDKLESIFRCLIHESKRSSMYSEIAEKFAEKYMSSSVEKNDETGNKTHNLEKTPMLASNLTLSIIITIGFAIGFFRMCIESFEIGLVPSIFLSIIYALIHPYIGKLVYFFCVPIFKIVDKNFEFSDEKSWVRKLENDKLLYTASWPLLGLFGFIIGGVAAAFSWIYRN